MQIELPDEMEDTLRTTATTAGFATVEDYVLTLVKADRERQAIQEGIDAMRAGDVQSFEDFDAELRRDFGFAPRS